MYHNESDMTIEQHAWLLTNLPLDNVVLNQMKAKYNLQLQEVPEDLSFDRFWEAYGKKINRKRTEPLYSKLSATNRLKSILNIKPYNEYLTRSGFRNKVDPERYIRDGYYETDWTKER